VAKDLDLTESALRNWVREADGGKSKEPAGALSAAEREELVRLRKEVRHLEMERDFLKNSSRPMPHHLCGRNWGRASYYPVGRERAQREERER
jgi:transposase-like protein